MLEIMMRVQEDDGPVMVIAKEEGPGTHCQNREFEWFASLVMVSIGVIIAITPKTIEIGAFRYLLSMKFSVGWLWLLYVSIGSAGICALLANGRIPFYGPHIR